MSTAIAELTEIEYPDCDGQPLADNTKQADCIVTLHGNLADLMIDRPDVFVAMDNLWYPVLGRPDIRCAPDVYVVFGRPKGHRGSYKQWVEGGIPLHVVFEILSPGNRSAEMDRKYVFYDRYGVEEYYLYDPDENLWEGHVRRDGALTPIDDMGVWQSPRLGIRFDIESEEFKVIRPDGRPFLSFVELSESMRQVESRAGAAERRADVLAAKLRALGIEPDA